MASTIHATGSTSVRIPAEDVVLQPDRRLTIFLNGGAAWDGPLRDAARGELVLKPAADKIRPGMPNLVQFHVSEPFLPDVASDGGEARALGIALEDGGGAHAL